MRYSDAGALEFKPITAALLTGLLKKSLPEHVNVVNAPYLAKERGIRVSETISSDVEDYSSLITVELTTDKSKRQVAGTLFGRKEPRIVRVDDYRLEAVPSGYMLVFSNQDTPGVIGKIGTILGSNQINIAGMQLGRVARMAWRWQWSMSTPRFQSRSCRKFVGCHLLCDASGIGIMVSMGMVPWNLRGLSWGQVTRMSSASKARRRFSTAAKLCNAARTRAQ